MTNDSEGLTTTDYRTLARFRQALRAFIHFSEEAAKASGVTPAQHQLMLAIKGFEGDDPPSLTHLAEVLRLKVHSAGELVDRAEANGLVERCDDHKDRRRTLISLTRQGDEHLEALTKLHRSELHRFTHEMRSILIELES